MNLLLSRILTYLNGSLFNDFYYKISVFIVFNYERIPVMTEEEFLEKGPFRKLELLSYLGAFGFKSYEEFQFKMDNDYQTRLNQIRVRLLNTSPTQFLSKMDKVMSDEELLDIVTEICEHFYKSKRIIIYGALYPMSISVELQTDMIHFGKPFVQYHEFDPVHLTEDDVAIIMSASGRSLEYYLKKDMNLEKAYSVLITQNKKYVKKEINENTRVILTPGRFEGVEFNYEIMAILDLIRLKYFQQYYL